MGYTFVIACSRCSNLLLAQRDRKTRTCPHCGFTIKLQKAKKLASAKSASEASIILRKLKSEAAEKENRLRRP